MPSPRRILVFTTSGGGGDGPPLIAAALSLHKAGHEVRIFGDEKVAALMQGEPLAVEALTAVEDLEARIRRWHEYPDTPVPPVLEWGKDVSTHAIRAAEAFQPDLLLCSDFSAAVGYHVKKALGIPLCVMHMTYHHDYGPDDPPNLFEVLMRPADLVLNATDPVFDPPPENTADRYQWIGTQIWEPRQDQPEWLSDPGDPWALMTLSSARQDGELELAEAAVQAVADFPVRMLVTLADTRSGDSLVTNSDRVRVETFVPHSRVLENARLCIAHAGHGIVAKALYFGVPMVLVPWDRDQPGVARRAGALGVARVIEREDLSPARLADAIREVLQDPAYAERARQHGERIQAYDAPRLLCEKIEAFLA